MHFHIVLFLQSIGQFLLTGEGGQVLNDGDLPADFCQQQGFLQSRVAAAHHHHIQTCIEGTVTDGAEGNAVADQVVFALQTQHPVLYTQRQDQTAALIFVAVLGGDGEGIAGLFGLHHSFQLHIGTQVHGLLRQLVGEFRAADLDCAGDVLHLGRVGDLATEAVFLDDQNGLACPEGIDSGSQSGRTAADDDNVVHKTFLLVVCERFKL